MRLKSLLVALGIGLVGCGKSGCGAGPVYATLADARGKVEFSPDGRSVVVPALPRVYRYSLEERSIRWTHAAERSGVGVAFSPRGKYVLIVESEYADPSSFVMTLVDADGSRVFRKKVPHALNPGDAGQFVNRTGRLFAISDDGEFVACGVFKQVVVFATGDGSTVHTDTTDQFVDIVAFEPNTHRLAIGNLGATPSSARMRVLDGVSGAWTETETFDGAFDPFWTATGLVFGSEAGLDLWDGKSRRTVLPTSKAFPEGGPPQVGGGSAATWAVSGDGSYIASWNDQQVRLWKTADGGKTPLFTHDEPSVTEGSAQRVLLAAFAPGHFRAFTDAGDYIDLEIPTGKLLLRKSFGALGSSSKTLFTDGVQHTTNYRRGLSPDGRFLAVNTPEDGTKIYLME